MQNDQNKTNELLSKAGHRRRISVPLPTIGRIVYYAGYEPGSNAPKLMPATIIAAPLDSRWDTPVTLEVVAPNGERTVVERVMLSATPEIPQAGCFTWPPYIGAATVELDEAGYALGEVPGIGGERMSTSNTGPGTRAGALADRSARETAAGFDQPTTTADRARSPHQKPLDGNTGNKGAPDPTGNEGLGDGPEHVSRR